MAKNKKSLSKTEQEYRKWKNIHRGLKIAIVPTTIAPMAATIGVNWNQWFKYEDKLSVAFGLVLAIITTVLSVVAILKKDSELMKKIGPFVTLGIGMMLWGGVCLLLAALLDELGRLLVIAGSSILAAACEDIVDKQVVLPKYEYMVKLADETGISKKGQWQQKMEAQAQEEGYVRFVPHD